MDVLIIIALLVLAGAAIFVVIGPPIVMATEHRWPVPAVAAWAGASLLLAAWLTATYRSAIQADEDGTGGSVLSDVWWLAAAAVSAAVAIALALRKSTANRP